MNSLIKNINEIEDWWNALSIEWKHFFCVNYLYNCDPIEFKEMVKSVLTGNYMEDWIVPFYVPSICHYTIKSKTLLDFHTYFTDKDELSLFRIEIEDLSPLEHLINLEIVQFPRTLKKVDCSFLRSLNKVRKVGLMFDHKSMIPMILSMQLTHLKEIELYISMLDSMDGINELSSFCKKNGVDLQLFSDENDPKIITEFSY